MIEKDNRVIDAMKESVGESSMIPEVDLDDLMMVFLDTNAHQAPVYETNQNASIIPIVGTTDTTTPTSVDSFESDEDVLVFTQEEEEEEEEEPTTTEKEANKISISVPPSESVTPSSLAAEDSPSSVCNLLDLDLSHIIDGTGENVQTNLPPEQIIQTLRSIENEKKGFPVGKKNVKRVDNLCMNLFKHLLEFKNGLNEDKGGKIFEVHCASLDIKKAKDMDDFEEGAFQIKYYQPGSQRGDTVQPGSFELIVAFFDPTPDKKRNGEEKKKNDRKKLYFKGEYKYYPEVSVEKDIRQQKGGDREKCLAARKYQKLVPGAVEPPKTKSATSSSSSISPSIPPSPPSTSSSSSLSLSSPPPSPPPPPPPSLFSASSSSSSSSLVSTPCDDENEKKRRIMGALESLEGGEPLPMQKKLKIVQTLLDSVKVGEKRSRSNSRGGGGGISHLVKPRELSDLDLVDALLKFFTRNTPKWSNDDTIMLTLSEANYFSFVQTKREFNKRELFDKLLPDTATLNGSILSENTAALPSLEDVDSSNSDVASLGAALENLEVSNREQN